MKKRLIHFLTWTLLLASASCSDEAAMVESPQPAETQISSNIRTADEVLSIAANAAKMKSSNSRAGEIKVNPKSLFAIYDNDSRAGNSDPLLFAVDFEDNNGFTIISAMRNLPPVICLTDNGAYLSEETRQNENFQFFMEKAKEYVQSEAVATPNGDIGILPFEPAYKYDTLTKITNTVYPLVSVNWNQGWPENAYCPTKYAGCVPIALAQALSFVEKPSQINLTFPERDTNQQSLNWTNLEKHKKSVTTYTPSSIYIQNHYTSCSASEEDHRALGRFVREIGHKLNAYYGESGTSARTEDAYNLAKQWLPNNEIKITYSENNLYEELHNGDKVAFVQGTNTNKASAHAWVACGTYAYNTIIKYYEKSVLKWTKSYETRYVYHNWGWGGNSNGYCLEGVFDTTKTSEKPQYNSRTDYGDSVFYFTIKK